MAGSTVMVLIEPLAVASFCRHRARAGYRGAGRIDGRGIDNERNTQRRHNDSISRHAIPKKGCIARSCQSGQSNPESMELGLECSFISLQNRILFDKMT